MKTKKHRKPQIGMNVSARRSNWWASFLRATAVPAGTAESAY